MVVDAEVVCTYLLIILGRGGNEKSEKKIVQFLIRSYDSHSSRIKKISGMELNTGWTYAAEGGKHAIFRYSGSKSSNCSFALGRVLRISKSDLVSSFSLQQHQQQLKNDVSPSLHNDDCNASILQVESSSQNFIREIVQPIIGQCYIDTGQLIQLPMSFCAQLYESAQTSGLIPTSRLSSWKKCPGDNKNDIIQRSSKDGGGMVVALLLRDYTYLLPSYSSPTADKSSKSNSSVFSVEIKPKAGYITTSPLVLPQHRCKYYHTRYAIQQKLMSMGCIHKGWQSHQQSNNQQSIRKVEQFTPSQYTPTDLFSTNATQIQKAISDLTNNMQNNYRVWCNGTQIFGNNISPLAEKECQDKLHIILCTQNSSGANDVTLHDTITEIVTKILMQEQSLLSNILSLQQLDIIDADGACMIYERLVQLCSGCVLDAETLIDEALLVSSSRIEVAADSSTRSSPTTAGSKKRLSKFINTSPYSYPQIDDKSLDNLLNEIKQLDTYISEKRQAKEQDGLESSSNCLDESILNTAHSKSIEYTNNLSKESCIYLLQNWLLSLTLCDVSFFINFQVVTDDDNTEQIQISDTCQSCDLGGVVSCSLQNQNDDDTVVAVAIQYEVKVIDCDPKPANKLHGRKEAESKFALKVVNLNA